MKLEPNDKFTISYKAKTHNGKKLDKPMTIFRKGLWTDLSREWVSKKGDKLLTYYDLDSQGYRTATTTWSIR